MSKHLTGKKLPGETLTGEELFPVEDLAKAEDLPSWEAAGLMAAAGWAPGKQVSKTDFREKLKIFKNRPQGGGRI